MKEIKPTDAVCFNCKFGVYDDKAKQVICHFLPPHPTLMQVPNPQAVATPGAPSHVIVSQALPPTIAPDWWCAQFAAKSAGLVKP